MKKEQASEPDMAGMLELADQEFKTTMINILILRTLMDKVDNMQEQMGDVRTEEKRHSFINSLITSTVI